jgi:hypothetical protein
VTVHDAPRPPAPTRTSIRRSIAEDLLDGLDALVHRHRALVHGDAASGGLDAELIAAEVAHQLAVARSALHRHPAVRPAVPRET